MITKASGTHRLNFRVVHLLYVTALVASALGTFGCGGLAFGVPILAIWAYVFTSRRRPSALGRACFVGAVFQGCLVALFVLFPREVDAAREAARRAQCSSNVRQLMISLSGYHDLYGSLPPAYVADENGRPMHSWRVLLLPFIDQQHLYDAYNFNEPWDGPNNRKLASRMPRTYMCPTDWKAGETNRTSYLAVVGPRTCWPGARSRKFAEVADGKSSTILLIESGAKVNWLEPRDANVKEATEILRTPRFGGEIGHGHENFLRQYSRGRQVAFADGHGEFLGVGLTRDVCEALVTIDDGRNLTDQDLAGSGAMARRFKIGNCFRVGVLVLVVLWPLPWVWIHPAGDAAGPKNGEARASNAATPLG